MRVILEMTTGCCAKSYGRRWSCWTCCSSRLTFSRGNQFKWGNTKIAQGFSYSLSRSLRYDGHFL